MERSLERAQLFMFSAWNNRERNNNNNNGAADNTQRQLSLSARRPLEGALGRHELINEILVGVCRFSSASIHSPGLGRRNSVR